MLAGPLSRVRLRLARSRGIRAALPIGVLRHGRRKPIKSGRAALPSAEAGYLSVPFFALDKWVPLWSDEPNQSRSP